LSTKGGEHFGVSGGFWRNPLQVTKGGFEMKKAGFVFVVFIALGVFMGGLAFGQAKPIEWKMISTWTPAINLIEADKYFVKVVNELSGGRFKITLPTI
jgi:TRAP-type mannitol/chloroaromatic compound transport system substrate-binding protein